MHRRLMFFARLVQRQARDVEQETKERNIQQRNIHHRNQSGHVESTDQNTIPHGRTIMYMVTPATEASV